MEIEFYWKHTDHSNAAEEYAREKFSKLMKYVHKFISAHCTVALEHQKINVKLTIQADGSTFVAEDEEDEVYAAIDKVEEKIGTQMRRHHAKHFSKYK